MPSRLPKLMEVDKAVAVVEDRAAVVGDKQVVVVEEAEAEVMADREVDSEDSRVDSVEADPVQAEMQATRAADPPILAFPVQRQAQEINIFRPQISRDPAAETEDLTHSLDTNIEDDLINEEL